MTRAIATPRPLRPIAPPRPPDAPRVADWPDPPFEDLRTGAVKGEGGAVRAVELVLSGAPAVGGAVALTVVSSTETPLSVCVDGPERGVVWRGAVAAGRTALTRGGSPQQFAFAAPGRYRFAVAADAEQCGPAVHVVEVDAR